MKSWRKVGSWWKTAAMVIAVIAAPCAVGAQTPVDRSDPAVVTEEERQAEETMPLEPRRPTISATERQDTVMQAEGVVAGAIRVEGATALPPATFATAIEPYLGRPLSAADLRALARAVANAARDAGFGLATAWIPPQSVATGVLRVRLDEGRIDAIQASGPAAPAVERLLLPLATGEAVRTSALERRLLLARDIAGVSVGRATLSRRAGRNVLRVETRRERARGRASIDNWGTQAIGPLRARLSADALSVIALGDALTIGGNATPLQPDEFQMVHASYSLPIGGDGAAASVGGYFSRSDAGGAFRDRDLEGDSAEIHGSLSYPLVRSRRKNIWGRVELALRDSSLTREAVEIRDERIVTLATVIHGTGSLAKGRVRARMSVVQGLDILGATARGDPFASRPDAGGVFTKLRFWTDYTRALGDGFSIQLGGEGQLASRPLPASEEIGLGGRFFLRGYDFREFAGDRGVAASGELRYDFEDLARPLSRAQLYAYADAGHVSNLRGGFGGGELASAGGGVRIGINRRIDAGIELGVPLADGAGGRRPNPRLSFTLSTTF
jgi:hemolysin activation/secretion protein